MLKGRSRSIESQRRHWPSGRPSLMLSVPRRQPLNRGCAVRGIFFFFFSLLSFLSFLCFLPSYAACLGLLYRSIDRGSVAVSDHLMLSVGTHSVHAKKNPCSCLPPLHLFFLLSTKSILQCNFSPTLRRACCAGLKRPWRPSTRPESTGLPYIPI